MKLYLASRSPRRHALLSQIDIHFETLDVDIDESVHKNETPYDYVNRVALEKAYAGFRLIEDASNIDSWVLGADTAVVLDDVVLGKAEQENEARDMLIALSGRSHRVYTGVAVVSQSLSSSSISINTVNMRCLSADEIEQYWQSGEPIGKAGGYAIQGRAAAFIERLEGSYSGVMGLPLYETANLIQWAEQQTPAT